LKKGDLGTGNWKEFMANAIDDGSISQFCEIPHSRRYDLYSASLPNPLDEAEAGSEQLFHDTSHSLFYERLSKDLIKSKRRIFLASQAGNVPKVL
jgi:hypothetical protein